PPDETVEHLVELITSYGPSLKLRRTATELIGAVAPERALEVLTPILSTSDRARTYPPDDIMLAAWLVAADARDVDRVPLLTDIALDFRQSQEVRHLATEALGDLHANEDVAAARDALRTLLVESSGNNYLRRKAAQALRSMLTTEELCSILETTLEREADPSFGLFLSDMIENSCR
ncbi:MAG: HEAT repeat domain-containing protein, partial [Planctomycetota bacterium]